MRWTEIVRTIQTWSRASKCSVSWVRTFFWATSESSLFLNWESNRDMINSTAWRISLTFSSFAFLTASTFRSYSNIRIHLIIWQIWQAFIRHTTSWIKLVISNRRLLSWDIASLTLVAWVSYILSSGWNEWPEWLPSHRAHLWQMHLLQVAQNTESFSLCSSHLTKEKEIINFNKLVIKMSNMIIQISCCSTTADVYGSCRNCWSYLQLEALQLLRDISDPPAVHQFMGTQREPAVGAVWPLLDKPAVNAGETAKFRTVRAQSRIPQFVHADKTSENISNTLRENKKCISM